MRNAPGSFSSRDTALPTTGKRHTTRCILAAHKATLCRGKHEQNLEDDKQSHVA